MERQSHIVEIVTEERKKDGTLNFQSLREPHKTLSILQRDFEKKDGGRPTMENGEVATAQIPPPKDQERRHIE